MCAFLAALVVCSCSSRQAATQPPAELLGHGYLIRSERLDEVTSRWRLLKADGDHERIATEAIVVSGRVETMLPTPFRWGCVQDPSDSTQVAIVRVAGPVPQMALELEESGQLTSNGREVQPRLLDSLGDFPGSTLVIVEVDLPTSLDALEDLVRRCMSGQHPVDLVLLPKIRNPTREIAAPESPAASALGVPPAVTEP